jgi:RNA polymerase sigma-70 factor, ECF subfamily
MSQPRESRFLAIGLHGPRLVFVYRLCEGECTSLLETTKKAVATTETEPKNEELVSEARAGDVRAFEKLVERHFGMVYAVVYARIGQRETAEDLAQEVFLRAYLFLDKLPAVPSFVGWLIRITHNLCTDWVRREQRVSRLFKMVPIHEDHEQVADHTGANPREETARGEEKQAVHDAIFELPVEQREIVLLHFSEGMTHEEIAERFEVHRTTVGRHIRKALGTMKGSLEPILRETAPAFRPRRKARSRAMGLVGAVAALSATAKSSLAASAGGTAWFSSVSVAATGSAAAATGATGGALGLAKIIPATIAAGGAIMGVGKNIAVAVSLIVLVAGGYYLTQAGGNRATSGGGKNDPLLRTIIEAHEHMASLVENVTASVEVHSRRIPSGQKFVPTGDMVVDIPGKLFAEGYNKIERITYVYDNLGRIRLEMETLKQNEAGDLVPEERKLILAYDGEKTMSAGVSSDSRGIVIQNKDLPNSQRKPDYFCKASGRSIDQLIRGAMESGLAIEITEGKGGADSSLCVLTVPSSRQENTLFRLYLDPEKMYYPTKVEELVSGELRRVKTSIPEQVMEGLWWPRQGSVEVFTYNQNGDRRLLSEYSMKILTIDVNRDDIPDETFEVEIENGDLVEDMRYGGVISHIEGANGDKDMEPSR